MIEDVLHKQIREFCDVLQQLSHAAADGPCWCPRGGGNRNDCVHTPQCARARAALIVGRTLASALDASPGHGFVA